MVRTMSQPDPEITARIDHLLRTDARLLAAAPLLGRVPAIVGEPKPTRKPKARKMRKLAPPRVGAQEAPSEVTFHAEDREALRDAAAALKGAEEAEQEDEAPTPTGAPWLKVAVAKRVSPEMRAALGGEALAMVKVDPDLWARLDSANRDRALIIALRGLHHSERKSDGADLAGLDKPPLQCWPDTAPELSHLVAALTDDPAAAARDSDAAEALGPSVVSVRPGEGGGFTCTGPDGAVSQGDTLADALRNLAEAVELSEDDDEDPAERARAAIHPDIHKRPEIAFKAENDTGGVSSCEFFWDTGAPHPYGWTIYQDGDLHDGFRTLDEVRRAWPQVFLTMDDFKRGRAIDIEHVIAAVAGAAGVDLAAADAEMRKGEQDEDDSEDYPECGVKRGDLACLQWCEMDGYVQDGEEDEA
jgi:predicted RNase H-like HicB family nuclease